MKAYHIGEILVREFGPNSDVRPSDIRTAIVERIGMEKLWRRLAQALVPTLFPILVEELIKHAETWFKVDINQDGKIGFEEKTSD